MLKVAFDPIYAHALPEGHRFPMIKYELIPGQLLYEGTLQQGNFFTPGICSTETILLTHTREYLDKLLFQRLSAAEQRKIGFPQSPALTQRELVITQGTIDCTRYAQQYGVSMNVAGGTHHAFADHGEGFCLLNDFAISANHLLAEHPAWQILVIDLDVHQGNGTAKIFEQEKRVFTFSMHGGHNYPFHKEQSDLDIALEAGTGDRAYLDLLEANLMLVLEKTQPELVFYLAGADVLGTDKFGKLALSLRGAALRDQMVFKALNKFRTPCVVSMGGGYSEDVKIIVEAHCNTFRAAIDIYGL